MPRPPRIAGSLDSPAEDGLFTDGASHADVALDDLAQPGLRAEEVRLESFTLRNCAFADSVLDGLVLRDGTVAGCDFANTASRACAFTRVEFSACRLTGITLSECSLEDVVFRDCRLDLASFRFGRLERVRFEDCTLTQSDFQGVVAATAAFARADLSCAQLSQADFAGSSLRDCRLRELSGADALRGTEMTWNDVVELASSLAAELGIVVNDDVE